MGPSRVAPGKTRTLGQPKQPRSGGARPLAVPARVQPFPLASAHTLHPWLQIAGKSASKSFPCLRLLSEQATLGCCVQVLLLFIWLCKILLFINWRGGRSLVLAASSWAQPQTRWPVGCWPPGRRTRGLRRAEGRQSVVLAVSLRWKRELSGCHFVEFRPDPCFH